MPTGPPVFDCSRAQETHAGGGRDDARMTVQYSMPAALPDFYGSPAMLQDDDVLESAARRAHSSSLPGPPSPSFPLNPLEGDNAFLSCLMRSQHAP